MPGDVLEASRDRLRHGDQEIVGVGRSVRAKKTRAPAIDLGMGRQRPEIAREAGRTAPAINKRIGTGKIRNIGCAEVARRMVEMDIADEAKLGRPIVEFCHGHMIAETVSRPGDLPRARRDFDFGPQDFLVVVVAGQQHHAVFAKGDRLMILIGGHVFDAENRHCRPIIIDAPASSIALSGYRQFTSLGSNMHFLGQIRDQTCPGRTRYRLWTSWP